MKKIILSALFGLFTFAGFAQVTLSHTYNTTSTDQTLTYVSENYSEVISTGTVSFVVIDKSNGCSLDFYSENHTFVNSINISNADNTSAYSFSRNVFNDDNKVEFIAITVTGTGSDAVWNYKLYNEDGAVLFDFGNISFPAIKILNGQYILIARDRVSHNTRVYTLGGTPQVGLDENPDALQERNAYPNPATQLINLQYELSKGETATMAIYNQNGQRIDELKIGSYFKECQLDVSNYSPGVYFYAYNGVTKKFIVQ